MENYPKTMEMTVNLKQCALYNKLYKFKIPMFASVKYKVLSSLNQQNKGIALN